MSSRSPSLKTLQAFRDHLVEESTLRKINDLFAAEGVHPDLAYRPPVTGDRRTLVEQHYRTLDLSRPRDVQRLLRVFAAVLERVEHDVEYATSDSVKARLDLQMRSLTGRLRRDGYAYAGGAIQGATESTDSTIFGPIVEAASALDAPNLRHQLDRLDYAHEAEDPWLAIGTAKEILETVCKTILRERGLPPPANETLPALVRAVREDLNLLPEQIPATARAAEVVRSVLGNLAQIAHGMAELRNVYGTGHGPDARTVGLEPRHARLAIGAAGTLAAFLIDTHRQRTPREASAAGK